MLRRFAPFMVLALVVLASVGVFIVRAITANRDPCAEVLGTLYPPFHHAGKNLCDSLVQGSDGLQAYIRHIEDARDRCGVALVRSVMNMGKIPQEEALKALKILKEAPTTWRTILVDRETGLPAYDIMTPTNNLDDPTSKTHYMYPRDLTIEPPVQ